MLVKVLDTCSVLVRNNCCDKVRHMTFKETLYIAKVKIQKKKKKRKRNCNQSFLVCKEHYIGFN